MVLPRRNRARLFLALAAIVGVTVWRIYCTRTGFASEGALYIRSDFRFDAPLFGCALALVLRVAPGVVGWSNSTATRSSALAAAGVAGLAAWVGLRLWAVMYPGTDATVVSLLGLILILSQIGVRPRGRGWLAWGPLVVIGQISYGVYLWQQLFLGPRIPGFERIRTFPVGLLATFAVAGISYRFLERPLLRLKDRKFHQATRVEEVDRTPERTPAAVAGSPSGVLGESVQ